MRIRKIKENSILLLCTLVLLSGCGATTPDEEQNNEVTDSHIGQEDIVNAVEIDLSQAVLAEGMVIEELVLDYDIYLEETDSYCHVAECRKSEDSWFYCESYTKDEEETTFCNRIYRYQPDTEEKTLLYETQTASWLNEMETGGGYLYWVEHTSESEIPVYKIMQCHIATKEVSCIADRQRSQVGESCLTASNKYLTWYDDYEDGTVDMVIYDIEKQTFLTAAAITACKYMPYENLEISGNGITFFSKDEEENVSINRYIPETEELYSLQLDYLSAYDKLAGCFSNEKYIGWFTEYSDGIYYFYCMETGELFSLNAKGELNLFHVLLADRLYINERTSNYIYCYDLQKQQAVYQNLDELKALQLHTLDGQTIYTQAYNFNDRKLSLLRIDLKNNIE